MVCVLALAAGACQHPYSAVSYRNVPEGYVTATICHDNKRTLNVSPEEWAEHREHGDYRGPCRERRFAGPAKPLERPQTSTAYKGNKERLAEERARYEQRLAIQQAYQDSLVRSQTPD